MNNLISLFLTGSADWSHVSIVTITGIVVVFSALILLILLIQGYGSIIFKATNGKKKKINETEEKPKKTFSTESASYTPAVTAAPVATASANGISGDILAVISAAVYAYSEASGTSYVVRNVRKSNVGATSRRSVWAQAGIVENTRPF